MSTEKRLLDDAWEKSAKILKTQETNVETNDIEKQTIGDSPNILENCPQTEEIKNNEELDGEENEGEKKYFNGVEISKLTKRQMKKYQKCLNWQEVKKQKRLKERQSRKLKIIEAKKNNIDLGPSRKELKKAKMEKSPCKVGICIDLSFDELMIDKDIGKTVKQILRVYTINRRSKTPMQIHLTSFNGKSKQEMGRHNGYENWDLNFHEEDYLQIFPKEKLVYLSSESENVIEKLEDDKIYIIGGLVDHNSHKGICLKKAKEQGLAHAQLPIGQYFWMKHRKVLTINQVFEILLRVVEGKSFKEAFELILPKRIEKVETVKVENESENVQTPTSNSQQNES